MDSKKRQAAASNGNSGQTTALDEDVHADKKIKTSVPSQEQIQQLIARAKEKAAALGLQARLASARNAAQSATSGNPVRPGANLTSAMGGLGNLIRPDAVFSAAGNAVRPSMRTAATSGVSTLDSIRSHGFSGQMGTMPTGLNHSVRPSMKSIQEQIAAKQEQLRQSFAGNNVLPGMAVNRLSTFQSFTTDKAKGGLGVEYHPALKMDVSNSASARSKTVFPKPMFTTVKANQYVVEEAPVSRKEYKIDREVSLDFKDPLKNPYFDPDLKASSAIAPRIRPSRSLKFVQHGKYIDIAEKQRTLLTLEKLKRDIAEKIKTTGIDKEIDLVSDKSLRTEPPPIVEWWDANIIMDGSYSDFDPTAYLDGEEKLVTNLVQHPVPIEPPAEPNAPAPRAIMLTTKERKKLRRQRRQEDRKERSEKIRLGLLPKEQPKVKIANMMRVFGEEAISNPTLVEAKVREQIAARKQKHIDLVASSRLTDEQRKEKLRNKLQEDTSLLVHVAVFRIDDLSHPQNTFKVTQNAQQYNLTGAAIVQPKMNVVIVEGGPKGIKAYKKLMLRRIDWSKTKDDQDQHDGDQNEVDTEAIPKKCFLVWEGEVKERSFRTFRFKALPTDSMAREYLQKMRVVQYWDAACNFVEGGI
ncbi:hypothetical protein BDV3_000170 [Batrachochytrium dendrobatidis]|nr:U4/U5/U6 small nuclear ribonucleoprotein prp3 [Batrachochytrium dendrobatidis]KAK5668052.1 U4/U5/U6 small nuclear ribonucleoprotein prp3 [Batrachochytrium dendrobatidis]